MAVKVAIIYYSATGTTYRLARAVEEGAGKAGANVRLLKVRELAPDEAIASNQGWAAHGLETQHVAGATLDDLDWADGTIFETPAPYGLPTAQLKQFLDTTGPLWVKGPLSTRSVLPSPVQVQRTAARKRQSSTSTPPFMTGAQLLLGQVTPTQCSSKRSTHMERRSPATMAPLNRTRPHWHQHDSKVGVAELAAQFIDGWKKA
jgi:NADPH-dependent FMN reductase